MGLAAASAPSAHGTRRHGGRGGLRRPVPRLGRSVLRDGQRAGHRRRDDGRVMTLDKAPLVQMLRTMILIREFDERAIQLRLAGKIYGTVHPYVGQEAVAVGVSAQLSVTDRVTRTHRGHGDCIAKGADIRPMMAELFGRVDRYCKGKGGSMHIADFAGGMLGANGIVGGGLPIACGAALAGQLEGKGAVTVCFFGDGAAAEGEFHEPLNIASLWKLPIGVGCDNNQYRSEERRVGKEG